MILAKKQRKEELLAAWKLRYYIEYLRLNTVRHIVDMVEGKNQDLEAECASMRHSDAALREEKAAAEREAALVHAALEAMRAELTHREQEVAQLTASLQDSQQQLHASTASIESAQELIEQGKASIQQEHEKLQVLTSELSITRLTCQDMVRTLAKKDTELMDLGKELAQCRLQLEKEQEAVAELDDSYKKQIALSQVAEAASAKQTTEVLQLQRTVRDKDETIARLESDITGLEEKLVQQKADFERVATEVTEVRTVSSGVEQEKTGLQKLVSELVKRLTQADEEAVKHAQFVKQNKAEMKSANSKIKEQDAKISLLQEQLDAAHDEIKFLVEENEDLSREIECHNMYSEEMLCRYVLKVNTAERHTEYSRFLEEELFSARKLYEKSSTEYYDNMPSTAGGGRASSRHSQRRGSRARASSAGGRMDMFGDMSEESYAYNTDRSAAAGGEDEFHPRHPSTTSAQAQNPAESVRSSLETWTGIGPVQPIVLHLNNVAKGGHKPGVITGGYATDFATPTGTATSNFFQQEPVVQPGSLVAEQRMLLILSHLEEKMKKVDKATESLRVLAEKADTLERARLNQLAYNGPGSAGAGGGAVGNQGGYNSNFSGGSGSGSGSSYNDRIMGQGPGQSQQFPQEDPILKQMRIDQHVSTEKVFAEMQVSLEQVTAEFTASQNEMQQLQERKKMLKETVSTAKRQLKKSRKASMKDPEASFLTEEEENAATSGISSFNQEIENVRVAIASVQGELVAMEARIVEYQESLLHMDQDLERSANDFFHAYGENITQYYPVELAHLIEGGADGAAPPVEHGHYAEHMTPFQLNTLYEEDDEGTESGAGGGTSSVEYGSSVEYLGSAGGLGGSLEYGDGGEGDFSDADSSNASSFASPPLGSPVAGHHGGRKSRSSGGSRRHRSSSSGVEEGELGDGDKDKDRDREKERGRKSSKLGKSSSSRKHSSASSHSSKGGGASGAGKSSKKLRSKSSAQDPNMDFSGYEFATTAELEDGSTSVVDEAAAADSEVGGLAGSAVSSVTATVRSEGSQSYSQSYSQSQSHNHNQSQMRVPSHTGIASVDAASSVFSPGGIAGTGSASIASAASAASVASGVVGADARLTSPGGSSLSRGSAGGSAEQKERSHSRQANQQAREHLAQLRSDLELATRGLDSLMDEIERLDAVRSEVREEIMQWLRNFHDLCGYHAEDRDRARSVGFKELAERFRVAQQQYQAAHRSGVEMVEKVTASRTFLMQEQHRQYPTLSLQQLEDEMMVLYAIGELSPFVLEDPFCIEVEEGLPVSSASAGGRKQEEPQTQQKWQQQPLPASSSPPSSSLLSSSLLPPGSAELARAPISELLSAAVAAAGGATGYGDAAVVPPPDTDDSSVDTTGFSPQMGKKGKKSKKERNGDGATGDGGNDRKKGGKSSKLKKQASSRNGGVGEESSVVSDAGGGSGGVSAQPSVSEALDVMQAQAGSTATAAASTELEELRKERKKLKKDLRRWTADYVAVHGKKPSPVDFDSFDLVTQGRIVRMNQLTELLGDAESAASDVDDSQSVKMVVMPLMTGGGGSKTATTSAARPASFDLIAEAPRSAERVASPSVAAAAAAAISLAAASRAGPGASGAVAAAGGMGASPAAERSSALAAYSVPTTPYADLLAQTGASGGLDGGSIVTTSAAGSNLKSPFSDTHQQQTLQQQQQGSKSIRWEENLFAEGTEETEQLLAAEQGQLNRELRVWAEQYEQQHGKRPSPEDFQTFGEEIKAKLLRKSQLKASLSSAPPSPVPNKAAAGATGSGTTVAGATGSCATAGVVAEVEVDALLQEQTELRNSLAEWTAEYAEVHGRKPKSADFASFDPEVQAKFARRKLLKKQLSGLGVHGSDIEQDAQSDSGASPSGSSSKLKRGKSERSRGKSPGSASSRFRDSFNSPSERGLSIKEETGAGSVEGTPVTGTLSAEGHNNPAPAGVGVGPSANGGAEDSSKSAEVEVDALLQEQTELRNSLAEWTAEYAEVHGRKPKSADFASFDPEVQAKFARRKLLKKQLSGLGVHGSDIEQDAQSDSGASPSGSSSKLKRGKSERSRGKSPGSASSRFRDSIREEADASESPMYPPVKAADSATRAVAGGTPDGGGDKEDTFSEMPPMELQQLSQSSVRGGGGGGDLDEGSLSDSSVKLSRSLKSKKFQSFKGDLTAFAQDFEESTDVLLQERERLQFEIKTWMADFKKKFGRKPQTDDYEELNGDIKAKLLRKNHIKHVLLDRIAAAGATAGDSIVEEEVGTETVRTGIVAEKAAKDVDVSSKIASSSSSVPVQPAPSDWNIGPRTQSAAADAAYSVPTTPFAANFAQLGLDDARAGGDGVSGDTITRVPGRGARAATTVTTAASAPATMGTKGKSMNLSSAAHNIALSMEEGSSKEELAEELKQLKKDLRRWNAKFLKDNGRQPVSADFHTFEPDIQAKLYRKSTIAKLLSNDVDDGDDAKNTKTPAVNSAIAGVAAPDGGATAAAEVEVEEQQNDPLPRGKSSKLKSKKSSKRHTSMGSDAAAPSSDSEVDGGSIVHGKPPRPSQRTVGSSGGGGSDDTYSDVVAAGANVASEFAGANVGVGASAVGVEGSEVNTGTESEATGAAEDSELTKEYNFNKKLLKKWNKDFIAANGRSVDPSIDIIPNNVQRILERNAEISALGAGSRSGKSSRESSPVRSAKSSRGTTRMEQPAGEREGDGEGERERRKIPVEGEALAAAAAAAPAPAASSGGAGAAGVAGGGQSRPSSENERRNVTFAVVDDKGGKDATKEDVDAGAGTFHGAQDDSSHLAVLATETAAAAGAAPTSASGSRPMSAKLQAVLESHSRAATPAGPLSEERRAELDAEYTAVKKALKKWHKEFQTANGRPPTDDDFDHIGEEFQALMIRKFELKQILETDDVLSPSRKSKKQRGASRKHAGNVSADEN
jgi:predicted  nucleic acid-binding Zn-ribbon protein